MANVPFGQAARATRTVSSGMLPSSCGDIDIALLLFSTLLADFFLTLYHSSIACIRQQSLSGVGFFSLCLVASFPLDLRESWPDKRNKPSCWQASPLQQSHGNEHHPPRKTTHLARLLAAFVACASDMGLR